ncbi:MAG: ABC-type sugar transport system, periplasmic component [Devosia sp.]|uniref:LacI family DNA-binding transcriptional regulator n=1 Tax=Devosia sp. TaxID=1871048 RepID=UPI002621BFBA|nr:LacI family DNA-binding transcriptional regulator [Devosia sp.]MDB5536439.1 ABC-type sugar transport system, periplasmic component [Devosia sp.]MDB5587892.1 ABC-type sugar transport system, periplasmic component [Devosia sp.]
MASRPTVADIAAACGLSVATVDRVLNARLPVRQETAERVFKAAEQIGYHGTGLIRRRVEASLPHYRLHILLQRPDQLFYADFARELERAALAPTQFRVTATISFLASQTPSEIANRLRDAARTAQVIAMVAIDHPAVTAAVAEIEAGGIPVFALLSDFASGIRRGYIGTDNTKVGRTAGWLIARSAHPGKVAIFVGSHRFHGHELREIGFRSYLRQSAPHLTIIDTLVNLEDVNLAHEATSDLLRRHPDLSAIYVAGGGMEGVVAALREENMSGRLAVVCNEINAFSRAALAENLITALTATPVTAIANSLVTLAASALTARTPESGGQTFLPFEIYVSENI